MELAAIFFKILNMSFNGACAVIIVFFVRLFKKKWPKKYMCILWTVVLIRLLCPFTIPRMSIGQLDISEQIPNNVMEIANPYINSEIKAIDNFINPILEQSFTPELNDFTTSLNPLQIAMTVGGMIWCTGIVLLLIYTLWTLWKFYGQVREAIPDHTLEEKEKIYRCSVASPLVTGIVQPHIYLPFNLKEPELTHVLLHERMHIQRKDHWMKLLFCAALVVHWFNPFVWLAYRLLERDMEMACDEAVLCKLGTESKAEYCESLLNLAAPKNHFVGNPVAFGESDVKVRIKNLMNYKTPYLWVSILAIVVIVIVAFTCLSSPLNGEIEDTEVEVNAALEETAEIVETQTAEEPEAIRSEAVKHTTEIQPESVTKEYDAIEYISSQGFCISYPENMLVPLNINGYEGFVQVGEPSLSSAVPEISMIFVSGREGTERYQTEAVEAYEKENSSDTAILANGGITILKTTIIKEGTADSLCIFLLC